MSDSSSPSLPSTPWHIWVVGGVSFLWNSGGVVDFTMTQTRNAQYMSAFTETQLAFFYELPLWIVLVWGVAVWSSLAGSTLVLLRKAWAAPLFLLSFATMMISMVHNYFFSNGLEAMGAGAAELGFIAALFIVAILLYFYARAMGKTGALR